MITQAELLQNLRLQHRRHGPICGACVEEFPCNTRKLLDEYALQPDELEGWKKRARHWENQTKRLLVEVAALKKKGGKAYESGGTATSFHNFCDDDCSLKSTFEDIAFDTDDPEEAIGLAIGAASTTWNTGHGNEVFDSNGAANIVKALTLWVQDYVDTKLCEIEDGSIDISDILTLTLQRELRRRVLTAAQDNAPKTTDPNWIYCKETK
jgi:hypothetical protein